MGELYDPYPKLPKNYRQIGERDQVVKLYMEDYVNTYLKRLYPTGGQDLRVGLLLGSVEMHEGTPYIFIDGAMEMEDVTEDGEKVVFTEQAWKKAYQNMEHMFPKRTVQGWFLCGAQGSQLSPLNYWKQHVQYFQGQNKVMYLNSGMEGEESIYITSEDGFYKLRGHCVYYERNLMMQDYMILRKDAHRVESGVNDAVTRDFRKRMVERKEEVTERRHTINMLGGLCTAMSIVILAGGIVMFNNYEKMQEMESVIASALPSGFEMKLKDAPAGKGQAAQKEETKGGSSKILVEEAAGEVYPTKEAGKETMASTLPGQNGAGNDQGGGQAGGAGAGGGGQSGQTAADGSGGQAGKTGADGGQAGTGVAGQAGTGAASQPGSGGDGQAGAAGGSQSGTDGSGQSGVSGNNQAGASGGSQTGVGGSQSGAAGSGLSGSGAGGQSGADGSAQTQSGTGGYSQFGTSGTGGSDTGSGGQPSGGEASASASGYLFTRDDQQLYMVGDGETLNGISLKIYKDLSHVEAICELNGLEDENKINSGQELLLP